MRILGLLAAAVVAGAVSCGPSSPAPTDGDGVLVLELGGQHASLRAALAKAGVPVAPPIQLVGASPTHAIGEPAPVSPAPGPGPAPQDRAAPPPGEEAPAPPPAQEATFVTVTLAEGQTLIHLARKHLGDGNRFRDILTLNGWSEADSRRLKPGTKVKIPKPAGSRRVGR